MKRGQEKQRNLRRSSESPSPSTERFESREGKQPLPTPGLTPAPAHGSSRCPPEPQRRRNATESGAHRDGKSGFAERQHPAEEGKERPPAFVAAPPPPAPRGERGPPPYPPAEPARGASPFAFVMHARQRRARLATPPPAPQRRAGPWLSPGLARHHGNGGRAAARAAQGSGNGRRATAPPAARPWEREGRGRG